MKWSDKVTSWPGDWGSAVMSCREVGKEEKAENEPGKFKRGAPLIGKGASDASCVGSAS